MTLEMKPRRGTKKNPFEIGEKVCVHGYGCYTEGEVIGRFGLEENGKPAFYLVRHTIDGSKINRNGCYHNRDLESLSIGYRNSGSKLSEEEVSILVRALKHIARGNESPSIDYARTKLEIVGIDWRKD